MLKSDIPLYECGGAEPPVITVTVRIYFRVGHKPQVECIFFQN